MPVVVTANQDNEAKKSIGLNFHCSLLSAWLGKSCCGSVDQHRLDPERNSLLKYSGNNKSKKPRKLDVVYQEGLRRCRQVSLRNMGHNQGGNIKLYQFTPPYIGTGLIFLYICRFVNGWQLFGRLANGRLKGTILGPFPPHWVQPELG